MKEFDLFLEMKFTGSVLDAEVILENSFKVGNWMSVPSKKSFIKQLDNYQIKDDVLDVSMLLRGKNGATGNLTVTIDKKERDVLEATIEEGIGRYSTEISV